MKLNNKILRICKDLIIYMVENTSDNTVIISLTDAAYHGIELGSFEITIKRTNETIP